ncbi:hypothetical protein SLA2020_328140 [Shorea laevis]
MNRIEKSINLKVDGQCVEVKISEEEWRVDPDWWLAADDRRSETEKDETGTESGFYSEYGCHEDHGINDDGIMGGFGDNIYENQTKGVEDLTSLCGESVEGEDDADSNLKLCKMSGDGDANLINGPKSDSFGGLQQVSKSPSPKGTEDSGHELDKVEIEGCKLDKGKQIEEAASKKKRRNLEDCYPEEMEDSRAAN